MTDENASMPGRRFDSLWREAWIQLLTVNHGDIKSEFCVELCWLGPEPGPEENPPTLPPSPAGRAAFLKVNAR